MVKYFSNIVYMALMNSYNYNMHRVPTYAEIIEEAIIHPVDKIKLPDRQALFIRNLPQMTRFDEVDDPADIGKEQEQIQETKLRALTLQNLQQGATQTIARAKDDSQLKQTRGNDYHPGPPPPPQPGMMRRIITTGAQQVGTTIKRGMQAFDDYSERQAERAQEHRDYLEHQQWVMDNEDRNIRAQKEQADHERMSWHSSHSDEATRHSLAALNGPSSTVYHYFGHDDEDDGPELPHVPSSSSSSSRALSQGSAAVDTAHLRALIEATRRANIKAQTYQTPASSSGHRGPDPGGGGHRGPGGYSDIASLQNTSRNIGRALLGI
jgi:hypothetical protein